MSKYDALGKFLQDQCVSEIPMTFGDIEWVTGVKLPPKAQLHRAWWSNNPSNNVMTKIWLDAGFRSEQVDMASKKLVFKRARAPNSHQGSPDSNPPCGELGESHHEFENEASANPPKRHPLIGALKGWLIIEPGYDLTQPAMPEWVDLGERYGPEKRK